MRFLPVRIEFYWNGRYSTSQTVTDLDFAKRYVKRFNASTKDEVIPHRAILVY